MNSRKFHPSHNLVRYEFWLWEYQRRNENYRNDIQKLVEMYFERSNAHLTKPNTSSQLSCIQGQQFNSNHLSIAIPEHATPSPDSIQAEIPPAYANKIFRQYIYGLCPDIVPKFIDKHKRVPKLFNDGHSGEDLIKVCCLSDSEIRFEFSEFHTPRLHCKVQRDIELDTYHVSFPCTTKQDLVALEIKYLLLLDAKNTSCDVATLQDELHNSYIEIVRWWAMQSYKSRLTIKNPPRAVGLWLWDAQEIGKLSQSKAIEKFFEKFTESNLFSLHRQFNDQDNLRKLFKKTKACIANSSVLPLI